MTEQCLRFIVSKIKQYGLIRTDSEPLGALFNGLVKERTAIDEALDAIARAMQEDPQITKSLFLRVFLDEMGKRMTAEITKELEKEAKEPDVQVDRSIGTPNDMSP